MIRPDVANLFRARVSIRSSNGSARNAPTIVLDRVLCRPHGNPNENRSNSLRRNVRNSFISERLCLFSYGTHCRRRYAARRGAVASGCSKRAMSTFAQNVFHAHAPRVGPHLFKNIHHAGSGEGDAIFADVTAGGCSRMAGLDQSRPNRLPYPGATPVFGRDHVRPRSPMRINEGEAIAAVPGLGAPSSRLATDLAGCRSSQ